MIQASSNKEDLIFDPFCGSGTTIDAAESLNRRWIGIDQNEQAIETTENRLIEGYGTLLSDYKKVEWIW